jgi:hypothetical protein
MRCILPDQLVLVPAFHTHAHSRELRAMSRILEEHPEVANGCTPIWSVATVMRSVLNAVENNLSRVER